MIPSIANTVHFLGVHPSALCGSGADISYNPQNPWGGLYGVPQPSIYLPKYFGANSDVIPSKFRYPMEFRYAN